MALTRRETLHTVSKLTVNANPELTAIRQRMPVLLEQAERGVCLDEQDGDAIAFLKARPPDRRRVWPVSRTVNNVRNDGPGLLAEVRPTGGTEAKLL